MVLSVSRRTDMVQWYPSDLVGLLERRYPPDTVHSVVIVTKFPEAILAEPVRSTLARYDQVVAQVTVTGLGGTRLEPRVPPAEASLAALPRLIDFVGGPGRVVVRVDPIVHWHEATETASPGKGHPRRSQCWLAEGTAARLKTNLPFFRDLACRIRELGLTVMKTSLATPYPKVRRRMREAGLELVSPKGAEREAILARLEEEAATAGVKLEFCCEPTRPRAACIDPAALTRLHPLGLPARPERAAGQREYCGCSHSIDLAWYASHPCPSGCLYCYANPTDRGPTLREGIRDPGLGRLANQGDQGAGSRRN